MSDRGKWSDILHGLRGLRLAVYDELLERGLLDAAAIGNICDRTSGRMFSLRMPLAGWCGIGL